MSAKVPGPPTTLDKTGGLDGANGLTPAVEVATDVPAALLANTSK